MNGNEFICSTKNGPVKNAASTLFSEYECFNCENNVNGSFLYIRNTMKNLHLEICDIIVDGIFLELKGSHHKFFVFRN